jgi:hypothetical protein
MKLRRAAAARTTTNSGFPFSIFVVAFAIILFAAGSHVYAASPSTFTRPLFVGSNGADVSSLQEYLKAEGYYNYPTITGYFGSFTWKAVAAFQYANNLEQVGTVGPKTRALLNSAFAAGSGTTGSSASTMPSSGMATSTVALASTTPCSAPAGLSCVPGTSLVQPYAPGNGYSPGFGGGGAAAVAVSTPSVPVDTGTLYFNNQFYTQGSYSSYPGMWYLTNDPTLGLGHTAVEGVDFESNLRVFTSTFPNNTIVRSRVPNFPPGSAGVYGFLHVSYGNYDGDAQQVPVTPHQVYTLTNFTNNIGLTTTGTSSNLLNEFYLTSASGDSAAKLFELTTVSRTRRLFLFPKPSRWVAP